MRYIYPFNGRT